MMRHTYSSVASNKYSNTTESKKAMNIQQQPLILEKTLYDLGQRGKHSVFVCAIGDKEHHFIHFGIICLHVW